MQWKVLLDQLDRQHSDGQPCLVQLQAVQQAQRDLEL